MSKETSTEKTIDLEFLNSIIGNDNQFEKELYIIYKESAKSNIEKLHKSIIEDDNNAWYMASHAFKGASASIGAFKLSRVLELAQKSPKENRDKKNEILNNIKDEYQLVDDFITQRLEHLK